MVASHSQRTTARVRPREQAAAAPEPYVAIMPDPEARVLADPAEDMLKPDQERKRETFIPVTSTALLDRLTKPQAWPPGDARLASRFFKYLMYWRQQQYQAQTRRIERSYEPFNPDSDLLQTRQFTDVERFKMQKRVVAHMKTLLEQANYVRVDANDVQIILTEDTHYGLNFEVDLDAFEELLIYYRGASTRKDQKRMLRKFFRKIEYDVPIYQRLFILFKLKPEAQRIEEVMRSKKMSRKLATSYVRKARARFAAGVSDDNIYMKLFRDMPRADLEMIFPNTKVKFRMMDKVRLGVTSAGGLGAGIISAAGKAATLANPMTALIVAGSLGAIAFRQVMGAVNQHQRYMVVMAQNLYFHSLADNRGVLVLLADRAAEEDIKEEMLLYSVLAKETVARADLPAVDEAIEHYLLSAFGVEVDFDLDDALGRLLADGIVTEQADGTLKALAPGAAAQHIDSMWDVFLDHLEDVDDAEGTEFVGTPGGARSGQAIRGHRVADVAS
ncbi:MAG: TMEM143 family protein [Hyphomicrobiaceae bacterium]